MLIYKSEDPERRKMGIKDEKKEYIKRIAISMLGGYLVTLAGITVLAVLLFIFQITEDMVNIGIIVIYVLSCLSSGFLAGKGFKTRKFLWGMLLGVIYYIFLMLISAGSGQSLTGQMREMSTVFLLCIGAGTLGGMIS